MALLVVLYSINVFLTFSLSLLGLCIYWWRARRDDRRWPHRIALSFLGLLVTGSILLVTLVEKFAEGGWMTVVITGVVIAFCLLNHAHYALVRRKIRAADEALGWIAYPEVADPPSLDPHAWELWQEICGGTSLAQAAEKLGLGYYAARQLRETIFAKVREVIGADIP